MVAHYQYSPESVQILRSLLPFQYVCIPTVELRFSLAEVHVIYVHRLYPGGGDFRIHYATERTLKALRRAYKGKGGWVGTKDKDGFIVIRKEGLIVPLTKRLSPDGFTQ
jgi:hypothetical protein